MKKRSAKRVLLTPRWRRSFLREWREFRGKRIESAAQELGLTHSQLSKIERGHHPYGQAVLEKAALAYTCTIVDLLTRPPHPDRDGSAHPLYAVQSAKLDKHARH